MGKSRKSTIRKFEFYETITDNGIESGYVRLANTQFHSDAVMDLSANSYVDVQNSRQFLLKNKLKLDLLCTMSILDKQHFTLNQTCPMS